MEIVVGYADSAQGRAALAAGIEEAKLRGARLHVLHCVRVGVRNEAPESIVRDRQRMEDISAVLAAEGIDGGAEVVMSGREGADALIGEASKRGADLLVIGIRRRSPVGKLVLGSSSQHLLLRADCPILAVKGDEPGVDGHR